MTDRDIDLLARKLVTLERQQNAASRATQLPISSVRLTDGEDYDLTQGMETAIDVQEDVVILNDYTGGIAAHVDEVIDYTIDIPDWIQEAGFGADAAWDASEFATDLATAVKEDLDAANLELGQAKTDIQTALNESATARQEAQNALNKANDAAGDATTAYIESQQAKASADGKNTIYYMSALDGSPTPPPGGFKVGDTWFKGIAGGETVIAKWNGTDWEQGVLIGNVSIKDAAINNAKIANLDAAKITTGTLNANRIGALSISTAKLAATSVTADKIATNAITAEKIMAGAVTSDKIIAGAITTDKIVAGAITGDKLVANAITGDKIQANAIDGMVIRGASIIGGIFELATLSNIVTVHTDDCSTNTNWRSDANLTLARNTTKYNTAPSAINSNATGGHHAVNLIANKQVSGELRVRFWINTALAETSGVDVGLYDTTENTYTFWKGSQTFNANTWTQVEVTIGYASPTTITKLRVNTTTGGSFVIDDVEIVSGSWSEDKVQIKRNEAGRAFIASTNANGQATYLTNGGLTFDYANPAVPGALYRVQQDTSGIYVAANESSTAFRIETQRGRGDTLTLYSQRVFLDAPTVDFLGDEPWTDVAPVAPFALYSAGVPFRVMRKNGVVTVNGTLTCNTAGHITGSTNRLVMVLPEWAASQRSYHGIHQGTGNERYYITISGRNMYAMRYSGTQSAGVWMPIDASYPGAPI